MRHMALALLSLAIASPSFAAPKGRAAPEIYGAWDKDPTLSCPLYTDTETSWLALANAMLESLSNAQDAINESKSAGEHNDTLSIMTEMLRGLKAGSTDYTCAQRPLARFNQPAMNEIKRSAAEGMIIMFHNHIRLNNKMITFIKRLETTNSVAFADQISDIQVERSKIWNSITPAVTMMLLSLQDDKRVNSNGKIDRLTLTKGQKAELRANVLRRFPQAESPEATAANAEVPTFVASLYLTLLKSKKASDE